MLRRKRGGRGLKKENFKKRRVRLRKGNKRVKSGEDKLPSLHTVCPPVATYGWAYRDREIFSWIHEIKDHKRKEERVRNSFLIKS